MELEEAISNLEMYRANNSNYDEELANDIDVVLEALENSIPKEVIEEKIKYLKKELYNNVKSYGGCMIKPEKIMRLENKIDILEELEGK